MARALDRDKLLRAFDEIGRAAVAAGTRLQIAVYGGSALMLASNFRFATEDVDVSKLEQPWPEWLRDVVQRLASLLTRFFPNSGAAAEKQKFLLKYMNLDGAVDAPQYPRRGD